MIESYESRPVDGKAIAWTMDLHLAFEISDLRCLTHHLVCIRFATAWGWSLSKEPGDDWPLTAVSLHGGTHEYAGNDRYLDDRTDHPCLRIRLRHTAAQP